MRPYAILSAVILMATAGIAEQVFSRWRVTQISVMPAKAGIQVFLMFLDAS